MQFQSENSRGVQTLRRIRQKPRLVRRYPASKGKRVLCLSQRLGGMLDKHRKGKSRVPSLEWFKAMQVKVFPANEKRNADL